MNLKNAIDVLKEAKYIGSDKYATDYDKRMSEAIDTVVETMEKPTYTAEDMEAFAEWSYKQSYRKMWNKGKYIGYSGMREMWEQERRKKED